MDPHPTNKQIYFIGSLFLKPESVNLIVENVF